MFGISSFELLVILLVALVVLGPEKLPKLMRTAAKWLAHFRRINTEIQRTINIEVALQEQLDLEKRLFADKPAIEANADNEDDSTNGAGEATSKPNPSGELHADQEEKQEPTSLPENKLKVNLPAEQDKPADIQQNGPEEQTTERKKLRTLAKAQKRQEFTLLVAENKKRRMEQENSANKATPDNNPAQASNPKTDNTQTNKLKQSQPNKKQNESTSKSTLDE